MLPQSLFFVLLALTVFANSGAQNLPPVSELTSPTVLQRLGTFTNVFVKSVKISPQLLRIFDNSIPSSEISRNIFYTFQVAMQRMGARNPDSLAKSLADAMYLSLPSMFQETYVFVIGHSMGIYLLSQEVLTVDNAVTLAQSFINALLKNYPAAGDESQLASARALSNGIADFLTLNGITTVEHVPAFGISVSKFFFAFSLATKPSSEVSVVASPDTIPGGNKIYGVVSFAKAFLKAIESSAALQSVFFSKEPVSVISQSWQNVLDLFCNNINCYDPESYTIQTFISQTYNYLSTSTYAKKIAEAFAIIMVGMGTLSPDNAESEGHKLASSIEILVNSLPSDANLQTRLGTILEAFKSLVGSEHDIRSQYPVFFHYLVVGFFSAAPVALKLR